MNSIKKFSVKNISNNNYLISEKQLNWEEIFCDKNGFYEEISNSLLNVESLYFFCTSNNDSNILQDKLNEKQKSKIRRIFQSLIKNPQNFYKEYSKGQSMLEELQSVESYDEVESFLYRFGIKYKLKKVDLRKDKQNISKIIKKESAFGIFGEMMLYNVVQYLLNEKELLLSKLSFITSPGTYSHGSDGLFINKKNNIIFYGEAKFTLDLKSSFEQTLLSLKDVVERIKNDNNIIYMHENDLKNNYSLEIFEKKDIDNYDKCILIFAFHGTEYQESDIQKIINKYEPKFKKILGSNIGFEILDFPVIDKEELKDNISKKVSDCYESY